MSVTVKKTNFSKTAGRRSVTLQQRKVLDVLFKKLMLFLFENINAGTKIPHNLKGSHQVVFENYC